MVMTMLTGKYERQRQLKKKGAVIARSRTRTADPADPTCSSKISSQQTSGVPTSAAAAALRQQLTCSRISPSTRKDSCHRSVSGIHAQRDAQRMS
jgi:hypothetical protein